MSTALARLALAAAVTAAAACTASAPYGFHRASGAPYPDRTVVGEAEITTAHVSTAYDAIARLRPSFISWRRGAPPTEPRLVYLDGMLLGGMEWLGMIPSTDIREIRLVTATAGNGFPPLSNPGGAIMITTKSGRPR